MLKKKTKLNCVLQEKKFNEEYNYQASKHFDKINIESKKQ